MKKFILTKKLAFFYKLSIVIGLTILPLDMIVTLCFPKIPDNIVYALFCVCLGLMILFGSIVFVFPFVVDDPYGVMANKVKADKYLLKVRSFETFLRLSEESIAKSNFSKIQEQSFDNYSMFLYCNKLRFSNLDVILIIRTRELSSHVVDFSNGWYLNCLESHFKKDFRKISSHISVTTLVCVDRINSVFRKVVDSNLEQEFGMSRFIVGISFGGKGLYVAKQKGGLAILKYKKYRKTFFKLFDFLVNHY